jgi:hypothetical protein
VKRERLDFLADNPLYTKRFAHYVGQRCRQATIKDIAEELKLDWDTVKTLEKQYMQAQLARAGRPGPKAIGIDEISIRKGHSYRIVVSDLIRRRPIWFGGEDRSEASMAQFYDWLGQKKSHGIRLAVMDMWKPFRNTTRERAPQAAVLFDKFHIMRHLGEALDKVRKTEYARVSGKGRRFIKGQKYTLLARHENGQGVPQDYAAAMKWYRLAAGQGHATAQNNLGFIYHNGQGVPQDYAAAMKWYRLAADQGEANAQNNLGLMYAQGQGVPQDYVLAQTWFNLSAMQGHQQAITNRDILGLNENSKIRL